MSLISVIMPYRQKREYVHKAIKSVLGQTYKKFELIIIFDDEKKDDLNFIKSITKNKKKIKIIINNKNIGAGPARNKGIKKAKGKYIAFIDSDDFWKPNKLEKQIEFIESNKYKFIFSSYLIKNENKLKIRYAKKKLNYNDLLKSCDIGLSTVMLEKSIVPKNVFPKLNTKEDYVAWLKICKKKITAHGQKDIFVIWNNTKNSLSKPLMRKIIDAFKVYYSYEKLSLITSLIFVFRLALNYLIKNIKYEYNN
jgi:teichuronic acid biosynthesis glycosyltransferase TuaG